MSTKFGPPGSSYRSALLLSICLCLQTAVNAEIVELSITGYWSEKNFKVIPKSDQTYSDANPRLDGKVLGVAPSDGQVTLTILVNTEGSVFFPKGAPNSARGANGLTLAHDFYGYREASLADATFSFGNAIWRSDGIITGLVGPDDVQAALWTDADITKEDPSRVSFRMFGKADGLKADLFVGGRGPTRIGSQFLLWEYYMGEEIRSMKYVAKRKVSQ